MIHQHRPEGESPQGARHSRRQRCSWICAAALLLSPLLALAQEAAQPAEAGETGAPSSVTAPVALVTAPATLQSGSSEVVTPLALQSVPAEQYSLPAGVCPVITDYLYQQCQQNPADAMCAPATTTE